MTPREAGRRMWAILYAFLRLCHDPAKFVAVPYTAAARPERDMYLPILSSSQQSCIVR